MNKLNVEVENVKYEPSMYMLQLLVTGANLYAADQVLIAQRIGGRQYQGYCCRGLRSPRWQSHQSDALMVKPATGVSSTLQSTGFS